MDGQRQSPRHAQYRINLAFAVTVVMNATNVYDLIPTMTLTTTIRLRSLLGLAYILLS